MADEDSTPPEEKAEGKLARAVARVRQFHEKVWSTDALTDLSPRGKLSALYRVLTLSVQGCLRNKIPMQAAALTYYCLMSLGPAIALALIISGFVLKQEGSQGEVQFKAAIVRVIQEVVPQTTVSGTWSEEDRLLAELAGITIEEPPEGEPTADEQAASLADISATLDQLVDRLINSAANGKAGVVGLGILVVLAVLMISRVENTFNSIWNVQFGRSWKDRFMNYFVFTVLAVLLGVATITMISASSWAKRVLPGDQALAEAPGFLAYLPGWMISFLQSSAPTLLSIALLTLLTTGLNKFMPNARVHWKPALAGGLVAALIIIGNQKLAVLYVNKVVTLQNLYGELSIVLILMFGMYLTWLFLLIGGQVTYAFQNVRFLADYRTWESLSARARLVLCFACLAVVARRFRNGRPAPTAEELSHIIHVPGSIVAECTSRLIKTRLISPVLDRSRRTPFIRYQPARPLDQLTLGAAKETLETHVGGIRLDLAMDCDPALAGFEDSFRQFLELPQMQVSLDALLARTEKGARREQ